MRLNYDTYYDKVLGGWVGKCAGGILGAPIEGYKRFNDIEISDKLFETNFANDDLDLQVLWLDMVMQKSVHIREKDFANHWLNHVGFPWNEYGITTRNLKVGLLPPESGRLNNHYWDRSMGCPIRSELWGMLCPGMPEASSFYAQMDGSIDHFGFSVQAEQYFSACASIAFIENDITIVLKKALDYIPKNDCMYKLVESVTEWHSNCPKEIIPKKIKSYYGDADFTSAPMNIAFTILALLNSNNDFNCIVEALHYGHDADCIVATAGALIGIIKGYTAIPDIWKKRVGNEIIISDAITNIHKPKTVEELTKLTCEEGLKFLAYFKGDFIEHNYEIQIPPAPHFHISVQYPNWDDSHFSDTIQLKVIYENKTESEQNVCLNLKSSNSNSFIQFNAKALKITQHYLNVPVLPPKEPTSFLPIQLEININMIKEETIDLGIPYYGSWLLLGPFIEDEKELEPVDPIYPEHGMASMPSTRYMNHDKLNLNTAFLSYSQICDIAKTDNWNKHPFNISKIHTSSFIIPFNKYFIGKGERTLYLYSTITVEQDSMYWVCFGTTAYINVYINDDMVFKTETLKRNWPGAYHFVQPFKKGTNSVVIKLDCVLDNSEFQFGLKEYTEQHPHQSQWATIIPFIK